MQCQREMVTTTMATDFGSSFLVVDLVEGGEASVEDMVVVDSEAEEEAVAEAEEDAVDPHQDGRITDVLFQVQLNMAVSTLLSENFYLLLRHLSEVLPSTIAAVRLN